MTLAIMLVLLWVPYLALRPLDGRTIGSWRVSPGLRGRLGLSLVFMFTGVGHFIQTDAMSEMLPAWFPFRVEVIYATGLFELAAAVALMLPSLARATGVILIVFLIVIFPANVYSAISGSGLGGHGMGPTYLLIRTPMQLLLIYWAWRFAVQDAENR